MWMKNLTVFVADTPFSWSVAELDDLLAKHPCPSCSSQALSAEGFVPPLKDQDPMVYAVDDVLYLMHKEEARLLPAAVIREQVDEKVTFIQDEEGRKVGRKEKAEIKEQVVFELLPKAFTTSRRTAVLIDMARQRILVDTPSANRAEQIISALRKAIGSLPVTYATAKGSPAQAFSQWLQDPKQLPEGFTLGDRCELKGTKDEGATVRFTAVDLGQDEILAHLQTGMVAVKVNLAWQDALELDVNDKLEIKRVRALDTIKENIDNLDADDAVSELLARISLQAPVLRDSLDALFHYFGVLDSE